MSGVVRGGACKVWRADRGLDEKEDVALTDLGNRKDSTMLANLHYGHDVVDGPTCCDADGRIRKTPSGF